MSNAKCRYRRRWRRERAWRRMGGTDAFLKQVFSRCDELEYFALQPTEFYARAFLGQHRNGERLSYEIETEPGSIDAGTWAPYDPGYAEAFE